MENRHIDEEAVLETQERRPLVESPLSALNSMNLRTLSGPVLAIFECMGSILGTIDTLLRGGFNKNEDLERGRFDIPASTLILAGLFLGVSYGAFMGLFAGLRGGAGSIAQLLTSMVKVPALFLLTLIVTFPSLYVFSALSGSRLQFKDTLRLLLAAIAVNLTLLASFGPVTGFFTLSTESYPFMILLNVFFFAVSGVIGLGFLRKALGTVFAGPVTVPPTNAAATPIPAATTDPASRVFQIWTFIYAIVGAQMGWVLRPFVGAPGEPFQFFRARQSNFFAAVLEALGSLLS